MNDQEIYEKVEEEVDRMILEVYEDQDMVSHRKRIMNFVTKAIRKTLDYKYSQTVHKTNKGGNNEE